MCCILRPHFRKAAIHAVHLEKLSSGSITCQGNLETELDHPEYFEL